jgi:hypothetical protein
MNHVVPEVTDDITLVPDVLEEHRMEFPDERERYRVSAPDPVEPVGECVLVVEGLFQVLPDCRVRLT